MTDFSYQLYSSRNFGPLEETLAMLGGLGYSAVEGYGDLFQPMSDLISLRRDLDKAGLTMASGHVALEMIGTDPERVIEIARVLDMRQVFVPFLPPEQRPGDADGWRAVAQRVARAAQPLRDAGLVVGWHNHDFELLPLPDGDRPIDLLLKADADLMLEFDVAWAVVAGADPHAIIARHGPRIASAHVKDRAAPGQNAAEDGWADLGDGIIDWAALLPALKQAGCGLFVMEHDNPSDDARFARRSLAHSQTL